MKRFDDVQFFGSYRVVGFVAWARALQGRPVRVFAYADGDGEVRANIGEQTPEEAKLRIATLSGLSPTAARDKLNYMAKQREAEESAVVGKGLTPRDAPAKVQKNARDPFQMSTTWFNLLVCGASTLLAYPISCTRQPWD
jgi:hypothetical protein